MDDQSVGFLVSGLIAAGGLIGFLKAGSVPSLVAGGGSGALMAYGVKRAGNSGKDVYVVLGISALLILVMGRRYSRSGKFMPAGLVTILSVFMFLRYGFRLLM